eukprot:m.1639808 g.1639808  ORF g.1639808 m.1639808 type:complete len:77 (+) comp37976_c0_seq1:221-451(+)
MKLVALCPLGMSQFTVRANAVPHTMHNAAYDFIRTLTFLGGCWNHSHHHRDSLVVVVRLHSDFGILGVCVVPALNH